MPPLDSPLQIDEKDFLIEEFLAAEEQKDLLRFSTAGSVDDGKSTLIGRLLYDSRNVYEDQLNAVTGVQSVGQAQPAIDFARLTDGLRAEREQGITIDVAYRYFSTQNRKFIIADTPGHEQYTRNMATGASTADLAIILIDARKGILTQSRRHAYIASLLGTRHLVAAINKMDLVDFSQAVFEEIKSDFGRLVRQLGNASLVSIPVSALLGDNVVTRSTQTPWYHGPTLLEHLENVPPEIDEEGPIFRMPVQRVIRPDLHYRGFAGQIARGTVHKGDTIIALPSGRTSRIASITTFDGELESAKAPLSVALTLEDEIDISRGDVIADPAKQPERATTIASSLVWFDAEKLESHKPYLLKHGTQTLNARVTRVLYRTNVQSLEREAVHALGMNDIGEVEIETTRPMYFDPYAESRTMGSFILIDPRSNATVAAGMIRHGLSDEKSETANRACLVFVSDGPLAEVLEDKLLIEGAAVVLTKVQAEETLRALLAAGVITIVQAAKERLQEIAVSFSAEDIWVEPGAGASVEQIVRDLRAREILRTGKKGA